MKNLLLILMSIMLIGCCTSDEDCTTKCHFKEGDMATYKLINKTVMIDDVMRNSECGCYYNGHYFTEKYQDKMTERHIKEYELIHIEDGVEVLDEEDNW